MRFCIVIKGGIVTQVIGDSEAEFAVIDYDGDGENEEEEPTLIDGQEALIYDVDVESHNQNPELQEIFNEAFGI